MREEQIGRMTDPDAHLKTHDAPLSPVAYIRTLIARIRARFLA